MKTIMCQHCEATFSGETKESVMMAMMPHYKDQHAEVMAGNTDQSKADWMTEFDRRWDNA